MELVGIVLVLVTATYAINILKIRMVVRARTLAAVGLEAGQSFLYVFVLVQVVESADTTPGMLAYVAGAALGTLAAMAVRPRGDASVPDHAHACCTAADGPPGHPNGSAFSRPSSPFGPRSGSSGRLGA